MSHPLEETIAHPLFPVGEDADDDEVKTVTSIHIARKENGKLYYAPRPRAANELTSLEQIQGEFGGGEYILIGYNNGRISARRTLNLPGRPKPMFDEGVEPETKPTQQAAQPPLDPFQAMMGGQGGGIMPILMMMFQQQNQAADRQTQMFIAMMQGTRESSAEEKAAARAELQASVERERINAERQMAMFREMMQARGSGGSGEEFTRGVEFMRGFANQQIELLKTQAKGEGEGLDLGSLLETLGQVLQGASLLKGMGGGAPEVAAATATAEVAS